MKTLDLPPHLISEVEHGNVIIMLGAGASLEATNPQNEHPPNAVKLAESLARKFLSMDFIKRPLNQVAEYAISESDLFTVQDFIAEIYGPFEPTPSHNRMTTFHWRGIATTNYDMLIEKAYERSRSTAQTIVPFIDNTDRIDDKIRDKNNLVILKLHGCISRTRNEGCPLIISTDHYVSYSRGRNRVFSIFKEWASERPIIFAGYSLQDQNLRQIIEEIANEVPSRPRHYLVIPGITDVDIRLWEKKKITAIAGTFDNLMSSLDTAIKPQFRGLIKSSEVGLEAILQRFTKKDVSVSRNATQFIDNDIDYLKNIQATELIDPKLFYKGINKGWSAIEQSLDVHRHLMDTILLDHFLSDSGPDAEIRLLVIKAHAGAGKTVLLQRMAWEASKTYDKFVIYLKKGGVLNSAAIAELAEQTKETIFIFIDNIPERRREIESFMANASSVKGKVTFVTAVRTNEWNQMSDSFTSLATETYDLPYLSKKEIDSLLVLLETHRALGTLENLTHDQRREALHERAGRQLLVALHEATLGKTFEEIITDEYERIAPESAQAVYLSVCLLNQFDVPVRAGMISRRYGLPFEEFILHFFSPLEQIIIVDMDSRSLDHCYRARHPVIAEIVVHNVLRSKHDLFNEICQTIEYLNLAFSSDHEAFSRLIQGRSLLEQVSDPLLVGKIYDVAKGIASDDPYLFQQMAIYEMNREGGNLEQAEQCARKALQLSNNSRVVQHTLAELCIKKADHSTAPLERERCLREAEQICNDLKRGQSEAYPYYTLIKIGTLRIRWLSKYHDPSETVEDEQARFAEVESLIGSTEKTLAKAIIRFPDNPYLRWAEAELARTLAESDRVIKALANAFELNNKNSHIALRLARCYVEMNRGDDAVALLKKAIDAKPNEHRLHLYYAQKLLKMSERNELEILYHLERGYVKGSSDIEAQFLHAMQLFVVERNAEAWELFRSLRSARVPYSVRVNLRYPIDRTFYGSVERSGSFLLCDTSRQRQRADSCHQK